METGALVLKPLTLRGVVLPSWATSTSVTRDRSRSAPDVPSGWSKRLATAAMEPSASKAYANGFEFRVLNRVSRRDASDPLTMSEAPIKSAREAPIDTVTDDAATCVAPERRELAVER